MSDQKQCRWCKKEILDAEQDCIAFNGPKACEPETAAQPTGEAVAEPQRLQTALFKLRDWLMRWELVDRPDSNTALQIAVDQLFDPEENCGILELLAERVSSPRSQPLLNELFQLVNCLWEAEPLDSEKERYLHGLKVKIIAERDAEPSPRSAEALADEVQPFVEEAKMQTLVQALGDVLVKAGVLNGETTLTIPQLLLAAETFCAALPSQPSEGLEQVARELLDAMETCHICKGALILEENPVHCENCSGDCENHEDPECTPIYVLHANLRKALARHFSGGKPDCCGDAHLELEAALRMLADIGFERETIQRDGYKEIVWRNKYMPVSGGKGADFAEEDLEKCECGHMSIEHDEDGRCRWIHHYIYMGEPSERECSCLKFKSFVEKHGGSK